ncbi:hypothetical protein [Streptomyces sp. NPDC046887]|uniref:hypothetical protein n=1 Tax=Streptomyces sp. NPDC046887 TaxID=3155472 RepID=UPI0033D3563B
MTTEVTEDPADAQRRPDTRGAGFLRTLRRHRLPAALAAAAVLAAAVALPMLFDGEDEPPCRTLPATTRALAGDPAAATRALDPGDDLARLGTVRKVLAVERPCADGARVLGRIVRAATGSDRPGEPHTVEQARVAYAVVAVLGEAGVPAGLAPDTARMLAAYSVDTARGTHGGASRDDRATAPAAAPEPAPPAWLGSLRSPGEAHALFAYRTEEADVRVPSLIAELTRDPEAFAVLYDAERAYFAHYLERLTDEGTDTRHRYGSDRPDAAAGAEWELRQTAEHVGDLMKYRARHYRDGTVPDLGAFDAAVRRHTRGAFAAAPRRATSHPPMGAIAGRPATGPLRGDWTDGRHQLLAVLDRWTEDRGIPAARAGALRQLVDDGYVQGLWLRE